MTHNTPPLNQEAPYRILVAVRDAEDLSTLLHLAYRLARAQNGEVYVLTVTPSETPPS